MTKIVIVPDLHLQESLILPKIEEQLILNKESIDLFVFLGDYFDQYGIHDANFSKKEAEYLLKFAKSHPCKFLLGNHDIPYLTTEIENYSEHQLSTEMLYQATLVDLQPSVAYQTGKYLFTHAGKTDGKLSPTDFETINNRNFDMYLSYLNSLQHEVSEASGGYSKHPSCVWARPEDWTSDYNPEYQIQIFGHTPMKQITMIQSISHPNRKLIFSDTFSLAYQANHNKMRHFPYGEQSFNIIDTLTDEIKTLRTVITQQELDTHFMEG